MKSRPNSLLLDTNVWIDNYLAARPSSKSSRNLVDLALSQDIELLYSVTSLKDAYFNIAMFLKRSARDAGELLSDSDMAAMRESAFACIEDMHETATAVGADDSDVWLAIKLYSLHHDIEDNLILAAMERSKASFLVTNDAQLIKHANCAAMTSEDMLDYLKAFAE